MEKKLYAVCLGMVLFSLVGGLINLAFQKSPGEIAKEECSNLLNTSSTLGIKTKTTVYIKGVPYECN